MLFASHGERPVFSVLHSGIILILHIWAHRFSSTSPQGIYEDLTVRIPPGTSSHTRIRVNGKGIRRINSHGYGDHYVHIKVKVSVPGGASRQCRDIVAPRLYVTV